MLNRFVIASVFALSALLGCAGERDGDAANASPAYREAPEGKLIGRVLLPGEGGRRGVEVHAWVANRPDGEQRQLWILPDADGRFARQFVGELTQVSIFAGSRVQRIDAADLPQADTNLAVDLGEIDLRELLTSCRVRVVDGDGGAGGGVVRVGLSIGPWHTGPRGELPSLGSAQFSTRSIGSEIEWLLLPEASDIYFLVERPDGPDHETVWRSGQQQVFGPYEPSAFPLELKLRN